MLRYISAAGPEAAASGKPYQVRSLSPPDPPYVLRAAAAVLAALRPPINISKPCGADVQPKPCPRGCAAERGVTLEEQLKQLQRMLKSPQQHGDLTSMAHHVLDINADKVWHLSFKEDHKEQY